jgi:hypothetical protein
MTSGSTGGDAAPETHAATQAPQTKGDEPATPPLTVNAQATREVRSVAKWSLGALGLLATAVFGAGPLVTRPEFAWGDNTGRLVVAGLAGVVGLLCLIGLVLAVTKILTPSRISLDSLPPALRASVEQAPERYFPGDTKTLTEFQARFRTWVRAEANLRADVEKGAFDLSIAPEATKPPLETLQRYRVYALAAAERNVAKYRDATSAICDEAQFAYTSTLATERRRPIFLLASGAALGALAFQLALAQPSEADVAGDDGGRIGYLLTPSDDSATQQLVEQLGIAECVVPDRGVPVLVNSGAGTDTAPWSVTTIQTRPDCPTVSFNLQDGQPTRIVFDEPRTVTVELEK